MTTKITSKQIKIINAVDFHNNEIQNATISADGNTITNLKTSQIENNSGYITNTVNNLTNYTKTTDLANVATSGNYNDLSNKPIIPIVNNNKITINQGGVTKGSFTLNQNQDATIELEEGGSNLVAGNNISIEGSTISAIVPTQTSELINNSGYITNEVEDLINYTATTNLSAVALSGNYNDLINKPIIGDAILTLQKNNINIGTFTSNAITNTSINIEIPTTTNELINNSGYITNTVDDLINYPSISMMETADNNLQQQIDAITASSDVTDIVGTYAQLQAYDTSSLPPNSIIKVLQDESKNDETTYYRWTITNNEGAWILIGEEGPYYTKSQANEIFVPQLRTINGYGLSNNITLSANDVNALSNSTTIDDLTTEEQQNALNSGITSGKVSTYDGYATGKQDKLTTTQQNAVDSGITSTKVGNYDNHLNNTSNPHSVTKTQVGLGNVDNTSDLNKPISTATQNALNNKQNILSAGANILIDGNTISAIDTTYIAGNGISISNNVISSIDSLPNQTGNNGKFLTTNGTSLSWAEVESGGSISQNDYYELAEIKNIEDITGTLSIDIDTYVTQVPYDIHVETFSYNGTSWTNSNEEIVDIEALGIDGSCATFVSGSSFEVHSECLRNKTEFSIPSNIKINSVFLNGNLQLKKDYSIDINNKIIFNDYVLKATDSISII